MKKLLFVALGLAAILAACATPPPEPLEVTIHMTEYAFEPNEIQVQVGQEVTIQLVNDGTQVHELMIGRDVMMMADRPSGYQAEMFDQAGVEPMLTYMGGMEEGMDMDHAEEEMGHTGFMVAVPLENPEATLTFTVTEDMLGEWEMGCFELEGVHYDAGMHGTFTVTR